MLKKGCCIHVQSTLGLAGGDLFPFTHLLVARCTFLFRPLEPKACPQHRPPGAPTPPPPAPGGTAHLPAPGAEAPPLPCPWRHHDRLANLRRCRGPAQIARAALRGQVVLEVRVPRHVRLVDAARDGGQLDGRVLTLAERSDMEGRCGGAAQLQGLFKGITDGCQHAFTAEGAAR